MLRERREQVVRILAERAHSPGDELDEDRRPPAPKSAAQTAQRMGLKPVAHIAGGFGAWRAAGGPVQAPEKPGK